MLEEEELREDVEFFLITFFLDASRCSLASMVALRRLRKVLADWNSGDEDGLDGEGEGDFLGEEEDFCSSFSFFAGDFRSAIDLVFEGEEVAGDFLASF